MKHKFSLHIILTAAFLAAFGCADTRYVYVTLPPPPCEEFSVQGTLRLGTWTTPCGDALEYLHVETAGGECVPAFTSPEWTWDDALVALDARGVFHGWEVDARECGAAPCGEYLGIEVCERRDPS